MKQYVIISALVLFKAIALATTSIGCAWVCAFSTEVLEHYPLQQSDRRVFAVLSLFLTAFLYNTKRPPPNFDLGGGLKLFIQINNYLISFCVSSYQLLRLIQGLLQELLRSRQQQMLGQYQNHHLFVVILVCRYQQPVQ